MPPDKVLQGARDLVPVRDAELCYYRRAQTLERDVVYQRNVVDGVDGEQRNGPVVTAVGLVQVGAVLEQGEDELSLVIVRHRRDQQRRRLALVFGVHVGTALQQQLNDVQIREDNPQAAVVGEVTALDDVQS